MSCHNTSIHIHYGSIHYVNELLASLNLWSSCVVVATETLCGVAYWLKLTVMLLIKIILIVAALFLETTKYLYLKNVALVCNLSCSAHKSELLTTKIYLHTLNRIKCTKIGSIVKGLFQQLVSEFDVAGVEMYLH